MEKGSIKILGEGFISSGEYESIRIVEVLNQKEISKVMK